VGIEFSSRPAKTACAFLNDSLQKQIGDTVFETEFVARLTEGEFVDSFVKVCLDKERKRGLVGYFGN
jgi:hypothetical protein